MSETLGRVVLIITTDDSGLTRGLASARSATRKFGKDLRRTGKIISTRLTLPILGVGIGILKMAGDFEQGMNRVKALSGATGKQFGKLETQAKELGATTQFSAGQAADAMGFLAQSGFTAQQIFEAMPATLNLAAAAQLDLGQSADIVSNIMTGFGLKTEETGRAADVLSKAFTSSNTDLVQLGEAMKLAGPVASAFGITFEETAAILGLMGKAGIQASLAGTSLRGALVRLMNPTKQNAELMAKLGLNVKNAQGGMIPFVDIMRQVEKSGAAAEEVLQIFGIRAGPTMLGLLKQGSGALAEFSAKLENSVGTAAKIADIQMRGLNGALRAFKSALEAAATSIAGSGLLKLVTDIVKSIAGWLRELAKVDPELLKWGVIIAGVAAAAGPLIIALGVIAAAISALLSPVGLVVAALAALAAGFIAFKALSKDVDAAANGYAVLGANAKEAAKEITKAAEATKEASKETENLTEAMEPAIEAWISMSIAVDNFEDGLNDVNGVMRDYIALQKAAASLDNPFEFGDVPGQTPAFGFGDIPGQGPTPFEKFLAKMKSGGGDLGNTFAGIGNQFAGLVTGL